MGNMMEIAWWRNENTSMDVPRRHPISWAAVSVPVRGTIMINSPAARLDKAVVVGELRSRLARRFPGTEISLLPALRILHRLSAVDRLAVNGHRVWRIALAAVCGLDAVGAVQAWRQTNGVAGVVLLEQGLSAPVEAVTEWAEEALNDFDASATSADLKDAAWTQMSRTRWQLIGYQTGGARPTRLVSGPSPTTSNRTRQPD